MKAIVNELDERPPEFANRSLESMRRFLGEVSASVLVATGLVVIFAGFLGASIWCSSKRSRRTLAPLKVDAADKPKSSASVSVPSPARRTAITRWKSQVKPGG